MKNEYEKVAVFIEQLGPANFLATLGILDRNIAVKSLKRVTLKATVILAISVVIFIVIAGLLVVDIVKGTRAFDVPLAVTLCSGLICMVVIPASLVYYSRRRLIAASVSYENSRASFAIVYEKTNKAVPFEYIEYTADIANCLRSERCLTVQDSIRELTL